jgi:hypothetical protein
MIEISLVRRFLFCINNYYMWPPIFCWQVHVTIMFNLSPITTPRKTMAMNDVVVHNMLLLTNNILPHKTCLKPRAWFLIKVPRFFFGFNTWCTNLGRFLYICWIEQRHYYRMSMWQWWHVSYYWHGRDILFSRYILTCHQNMSRNILTNMDGI